MNFKAIRYLAGIVILLPILFYTAGLIDIRPLRELEYKLYDARLRAFAPEGVDPRVVIIDIDEKSLAATGQWPWNRDVVARLVTNLFEQYNIELLGLDMVFAEPDIDVTLLELKSTFSDSNIRNETLRQIIERPSRDMILGDTLQRYEVVTGFVFGKDPELASTGALPEPVFAASTGLADNTLAPQATRYSGNLEVLQQDKAGGFFSLFSAVDSDGIIRKMPLLNNYQGALYPSLSLSVAQRYLGSEIAPVLVDDLGSDSRYAALEGLELGVNRFTVDQNSAVYIPYRGHKRAFRYISASDVLAGNVEKSTELENVIALLGTSSAGLVDNRATPIHQLTPGVEIHANLVAGLLDGEFKRHPGWARGASTVLTAAVGLLLIFLLPSLSALSMTIVTAVITSGYIAGNLALWQRNDFIVELAPFLLAAFVIYLGNLITGFIIETRSRLQLKNSFGLYVPPEIIDDMQGQPIDSLLKSDKKEMTVLFVDIRGFTTISERLDPDTLTQLINAFLTPMTEVVHKHGGAIDKYMGDALMAFWGAPIEQPGHAESAVTAAMDMQFAMTELNEEFAAKGWPRIDIGIGINTGIMNVGNLGSAFRMAYTVMGDSVNLGSRLEGLTKQYGVPVLIGENTASKCENMVLIEVDQVRVKGKRHPVKIFTPVGREGEVSRRRLQHREQFARALACYRIQNWTGALDLLTNLYLDQSKALYHVYIKRVEHFIESPPPSDWDGVFDFEIK